MAPSQSDSTQILKNGSLTKWLSNCLVVVSLDGFGALETLGKGGHVQGLRNYARTTQVCHKFWICVLWWEDGHCKCSMSLLRQADWVVIGTLCQVFEDDDFLRVAPHRCLCCWAASRLVESLISANFQATIPRTVRQNTASHSLRENMKGAERKREREREREKKKKKENGLSKEHLVDDNFYERRLLCAPFWKESHL